MAAVEPGEKPEGNKLKEMKPDRIRDPQFWPYIASIL
jgi:hypothetical protein